MAASISLMALLQWCNNQPMNAFARTVMLIIVVLIIVMKTISILHVLLIMKEKSKYKKICQQEQW